MAPLLSGFFRRLWLSVRHRTPDQRALQAVIPKCERGKRHEGGWYHRSGHSIPLAAGKAGEAIQQDQELMKAALARAGKRVKTGWQTISTSLSLSAMYVLKGCRLLTSEASMIDPPSSAYQRGDGQEAGSKSNLCLLRNPQRSNAWRKGYEGAPVSYRRTESLHRRKVLVPQDRYASGYLTPVEHSASLSYCMCRRLAPLAAPDVSQANRTEKAYDNRRRIARVPLRRGP